MRNTTVVILLLVAVLTLTACGTTTALLTRGVVVGARVWRGVIGTASEQEVLCNYYNQHRTEIETVRTYYRANWQSVPESDKPVLLKINEQLNACEITDARTPLMQKTRATVLLDAFKRAVAIYRELKATGVI